MDSDKEELLSYIQANVIGRHSTFTGPFGKRQVVFGDCCGSGGSLQFLEDFIQKQVLGSRGGSGASTCHTALQANLFREEARCIVSEACKCNKSGEQGDRVILGGTLGRLVRALRLRAPQVFVGPATPARLLLPWIRTSATIIRVNETKEGYLDLNDLENKLQKHFINGRKLVGYFPTASRVTGASADTVAATMVLHQYGALSIWEHTGHGTLDMNPNLPGLEDNRMVGKDAVVFSFSGLAGGTCAPTILIVKENLLKTAHMIADDYQDLIELDEECSAVEAARAGLAMQLKEAIGQQAINQKQDYIIRQVLSHVRNIPELTILGSNASPSKRLPVFSFLVRHPRGVFLHHNFVSAVLNDVFGIQASTSPPGCADYGQELLGIDENLSKEYAKLLGDNTKQLSSVRDLQNNEHMRPGFCRISFPYFISESELAFILEAIKMVATEAWKILPQYSIDEKTGQWIHRTHSFKDVKTLAAISYDDGKLTFTETTPKIDGIFPQTYFECLQTARNLFSSARKSLQKYPLVQEDFKFNARLDYLRWYMLPKESQDLLLGNSINVKHIVPFDPKLYNSGRRKMTSLSRGNSSPGPGNSPRHYSLSAIDTSPFAVFNSKYKVYSRVSSLQEQPSDTEENDDTILVKPPVRFAVGDVVSTSSFAYNTPISNLIKAEKKLSRARCHSLGSESPPPLHPKHSALITRLSESEKRPSNTCNCSSQTDLQCLDDITSSPGSSLTYIVKGGSNSDCSQIGRSSPTTSIASQNSEDLHAYVKEMTREIATEIKSEIREVISSVENVLENSEPSSINYGSSLSDRNSVSISDVAEYLMGVSREMASEVKHEIREMVNQVDEMISPDVNGSGVSFYLSSPSGSRKNSPPEMIKRRNRSGSETTFTRVKSAPVQSPLLKPQLKKSPTSPVFQTPEQMKEEAESVFFRSHSAADSSPPQRSPDYLSSDVSRVGNLSFNSSETSSPDTIIQVLNNVVALNNTGSQKLSDEENSCTESDCQQLYCRNKTWYHNNSLSSQDSGINMSFQEQDTFNDNSIKRRPNYDMSCHRRKKCQGRMRSSSGLQRSEKGEVPDIIEGVPVCQDQYMKISPNCRAEYNLSQDYNSQLNYGSNYSDSDYSSQRTSRTSTNSSLELSDLSRKSSYNTDSLSSKKSHQTTTDDYGRYSDLSYRHYNERPNDLTISASSFRSRLSSDSSDSSTEYPLECLPLDENGKWHCPPKSVWKGSIEAIQEFGMIRHQDKVLVCISGGTHSLTLLHTLHQYQFYARAKGINFSLGAITIQDGVSDADPLHLMAYCKTLGVKYIYQDSNDSNFHAKILKDTDLCSFTNHWIRRQIYKSASEHGYNVIATGQHLDDVAHSFIISVFNNGRLKTMKAHYFIRELNLRVIRPFIYVREKNLLQFAESRHLPKFCLSKNWNSALMQPQEDIAYSEELDSKDRDTTRCLSAPEREKSISPISSKVNRSLSAPSGSAAATTVSEPKSVRIRAASAPCAPISASLLVKQEAVQPSLFASLKAALHPLISSRNIDKDMKEYRHRKRSVIQMRNGAPVYNSDEGTDEEPVS